MKKYNLTADTCRLPVVNMMTGRVIARSFTPYFDKETLSLKYLALNKDENGYDRVYVPFSSLCFINDVCTMVRLPDKPYTPDEKKCCELIGAPLTAKVGVISLFNFGSIAKADVEEDGDIVSVTLNDGHSFLIPGEDSPENASVNEAFASEAFQCMNDSVRISPTVISVTSSNNENAFPERKAPVRIKEEASASDFDFGSQAIDLFDDMDDFEKPVKKAAPSKKSSSKSKPKSKPKAKPAAKKEKAVRDKEGGMSFGKKLAARILGYIPPVVAMLIFFFLYFFFFNFFIK